MITNQTTKPEINKQREISIVIESLMQKTYGASVLLTNRTRKVSLLQFQLQNKSTSVIYIECYAVYDTFYIRNRNTRNP